jgi:hypothetical protein
MADITVEQLEQLPLAGAKTHVAELRAVHIHQALPGAPATVETEAGHFRLSKRLGLVAAKAFAVGASDSAAPRRGRLGTILSAMAGMELTPSENAEEEPDEQPDPLQALAGDLAKEAMARLQGLIHDSVAKQFAQRRDALVADAIRSLV